MMRVGSKVFQGIAAPNTPVVAGEQHGGSGTGKLGTVSGARTISVGGAKPASVSGGASGKSASSTAGLPTNLWYEVGVLWAMPPATSGGTPKQGSTQSVLVPYPIAFDNQSAFRQCMQANIQVHGAKIEFPPGAGPYGASFQVASATSSASGMTSTCSYFAAVLGMAKYASNFVHSMGACFIDPEGRPMSCAGPIVPVASLADVRAPSPQGTCNVRPALVMICGSLDWLPQIGLQACAFQHVG